MNIKKVFILLTIIMLCFTIYKIVSTYALLESKTQKNVKADIGKWNITLNSEDVTTSATKEFVMDSFKISQSPYTKENKIAPGMNGIFEIEIKPQDTQVSIRYDITIDESKLTNQAIKLNEVIEKNNNNTIIKTNENTYTGVIPLEKIDLNYSDLVEISFAWENIEENSMNDIEIGSVYDTNIEIPITVQFSQYLGESIQEFNPIGE